jgi:hypothetical protein
LSGFGRLLIPLPSAGRIWIFLVHEHHSKVDHRVGLPGLGRLLIPLPSAGKVAILALKQHSQVEHRAGVTG